MKTHLYKVLYNTNGRISTALEWLTEGAAKDKSTHQNVLLVETEIKVDPPEVRH